MYRVTAKHRATETAEGADGAVSATSKTFSKVIVPPDQELTAGEISDVDDGDGGITSRGVHLLLFIENRQQSSVGRNGESVELWSSVRRYDERKSVTTLVTSLLGLNNDM